MLCLLLKFYFCRFVQFSAFFFAHVKHGLASETEMRGEQIARKGLHGIVVLTCRRVEESSDGTQVVLYLGELRLQLQKALVRFQVGVPFQHHLQPREQMGEVVFCLYLLRHAACLDSCRTGLDDTLQRIALIYGIALHRLYKIGYQVVPQFELYIDITEGILTVVTQLNERVVQADEP